MRCAEGSAVGFSFMELGRFLPSAPDAGDSLPGGLNCHPGRELQSRWLQRWSCKDFIRKNKVVVTRGRAFYNPSITVLDIVVMLSVIRSSPPSRTDVYSASECLSIDFHFRISQEH